VTTFYAQIIYPFRWFYLFYMGDLIPCYI